MSVARKLFLATALIATGLGVAALLGEPAAVRQTLDSALHPRSSPNSAVSVLPAPARSHVQLLPDTAPSGTPPLAVDAPPLLASLAPLPFRTEQSGNRDRSPFVVADSQPLPRASGDSTPGARLRNEAPRPLGTEARTPATIRRAPSVDEAGNLAVDNRNTRQSEATTAGPRTAQRAPAEFGEGTTDVVTASAAAFVAPAVVPGAREVGPPPWPAAIVRDEPRTHVVVDGDSLERLAERYLDDPQRGREIFDLNRETLQNPDLLPIGAELKIPERIANHGLGVEFREPNVASDATIRAAANRDLAPIRPLSPFDPYAVAAPQAQLTRPVAVE